MKNLDRRGAGVRATAVLAIGITAMVIGAQAAEASTIHACVKPKSGATRIVGAKAKCHHGEQKLSWSTTGPRGPAGTTGPAGSPGAEGKPGAAALFAAPLQERTEIPAAGAAVVTKKVLPPGDYALSAKTTLVFNALAAKSAGKAYCVLVDQPGTAGTGEVTVIDTSGVTTPLAEEEGGEFEAESVLMLEASLASKVTSTVSMGCYDVNETPTDAAYTQLEALQVSTIA